MYKSIHFKNITRQNCYRSLWFFSEHVGVTLWYSQDLAALRLSPFFNINCKRKSQTCREVGTEHHGSLENDCRIAPI